MVTVPDFRIGQVGLQTVTPNLNTSAPAAAFQGTDLTGVVKGLDALGAKTDVIAMDAAEKRNIAAAMDADRKVGDELRALLHDKNTGLFQRKGGNALGVGDEAAKRLEEIHNRQAATITNPGALRRFEQAWESRRSGALDGVAKHEAAQNEVYLKETVEAYTAGAVSDAIENYQDPDAVAESLSRAEAALRMNLDGQSEEVIGRKVELMKSQAVAGIIERVMIDSPSQAKALYEEMKGDLQGEDQSRIEKQLAATVDREKEQKGADEIIGLGLSRAAALEKAREKYTGKMRDGIVDRIKARYTENEQDRADYERNLRQEAWKLARSGDTTQITPPMWEALGTSASSLESYATKRRNGEDVKTNMETYYDLEQMAADDPLNFANNIDVMGYATDLSEADLKRFSNIQASIKEAVANGDPPDSAVDDIASTTEMVNTALRRMNIKPNAEGAGAGRVTKFREKVSAGVRRVENSKGGEKATPEEVQRVINTLSLQVRADAGFWSMEESGRAFDIDISSMSQDERDNLRVDLDSISATEQQEITDMIRASGKEPTDDLIEQLRGAAITQDIPRTKRLLGIK
jgi:hypothetical protein